MNLELKKAIDQISKDKGLDRNMLIDTLEDAVRTSVLRRFSEDMDVEVSYAHLGIAPLQRRYGCGSFL